MPLPLSVLLPWQFCSHLQSAHLCPPPQGGFIFAYFSVLSQTCPSEPQVSPLCTACGCNSIFLGLLTLSPQPRSSGCVWVCVGGGKDWEILVTFYLYYIIYTYILMLYIILISFSEVVNLWNPGSWGLQNNRVHLPATAAPSQNFCVWIGTSLNNLGFSNWKSAVLWDYSGLPNHCLCPGSELAPLVAHSPVERW